MKPFKFYGLIAVKLEESIHSLWSPLLALPSMADFCSSFFVLPYTKEKNNEEGEEEKKLVDVSSKKHVTPAQLTAENNFGLQASEWLTQTSLLLLFLSGGRGLGAKE